MMKKNTKPNYKRIYSDIIDQKFPHKKAECQKLLNKKNLSSIDILKLNKKVFGFTDQELEKESQKHRSYNTADILNILDYQKNHKMNNHQVARHFGTSRNTIAKWKKIFDYYN